MRLSLIIGSIIQLVTEVPCTLPAETSHITNGGEADAVI